MKNIGYVDVQTDHPPSTTDHPPEQTLHRITVNTCLHGQCSCGLTTGTPDRPIKSYFHFPKNLRATSRIYAQTDRPPNPQIIHEHNHKNDQVTAQTDCSEQCFDVLADRPAEHRNIPPKHAHTKIASFGNSLTGRPLHLKIVLENTWIFSHVST